MFQTPIRRILSADTRVELIAPDFHPVDFFPGAIPIRKRICRIASFGYGEPICEHTNSKSKSRGRRNAFATKVRRS